MIDATAEEVKALRSALIPFARIWAVNEPLSPDLRRPVQDFIAGEWPTMADAKRAYDLAWKHRRMGQ